MYACAIVLAAGKGERFASKLSKPLVEINHIPAIIYCLKVLEKHPRIDEIIVVVNLKNKAKIIQAIKNYRIKKIKCVVLGGEQRQDSVWQGLKAIDGHTELILIHDGVRPFVADGMVSEAIKKAQVYGGAVVGVPLKPTIKRAKSNFAIEETLSRDSLWEVQTPQVFKKDLILRAYKKYGHIPVTDDSALVEKLGVRPRMVMGSYLNIKITTPEDLVVAEAIARKIYVKL